MNRRARRFWGRTAGARLQLVGALVGTSLILAACGAAPDPGDEESADTDEPPSPSVLVACSIAAGELFPASFLEGPEMSRGEFADTQIGAVVEAFFVSGPGEPESDRYLDAAGFAIVSDQLVLGYVGDAPSSSFSVVDGQVAGWGGCHPNWVTDDLVARRWQPSGSLDPAATTIPIQVEGGACVTNDGTEVLTDVIEIDIDETTESIEVTAWARDQSFEGACAGVGVMINSQIELGSALGDRTMLDAGLIPAQVVDTSVSDSEPPTEPDDGSVLGRLDCAAGEIVEDIVPDVGQDQLDVARSAAPDVVEVEPGRPLWWWGLNSAGTVVAAVALGDAPGADYQLWTCKPAPTSS